jgi:hypothetical protein
MKDKMQASKEAAKTAKLFLEKYKKEQEEA